jgi:hypothetical protein
VQRIRHDSQRQSRCVAPAISGHGYLHRRPIAGFRSDLQLIGDGQVDDAIRPRTAGLAGNAGDVTKLAQAGSALAKLQARQVAYGRVK